MESRAANNHATWYDVQVLAFALFSGDLDTACQVSQAVPKVRIRTQIASDGSLPRELVRTRALHYCDFALQAFAELATLASRVDVNLWDCRSPTTGAGIRDAVRFLAPYWSGQQWPYPEISHVDAFQENAQTLQRAISAYPHEGHAAVLSQLSAGRTDFELLRLRLGYWPD